MDKIKLYTEKQVKEFLKEHTFIRGKVIKLMISNSLIPIELTSDEEIGVVALKIISTLKDELTTQEETIFLAGFQSCDKYIKEKIKNQIK